MSQPTVQIRIRGYQFSVTAPYRRGDPLGEAEVVHLNDLRADNVRNNISKIVLDAIAGLTDGAMLSAEVVAELQATITKYDSRYHLQLKHQAKPRLGVIETEARAIAEARLDEELRRQGIVALTDAEYERVVEQYMALNEIQELARQRVTTKAAVAKQSLESLL